MSLKALIEKANAKLDHIKIKQRGKKLSLRGTLPKKPGKGSGVEQTFVSLGLSANEDGVRVALAKARKLEDDLLYERFNWGDWQDITTTAKRSH